MLFCCCCYYSIWPLLLMWTKDGSIPYGLLKSSLRATYISEERDAETQNPLEVYTVYTSSCSLLLFRFLSRRAIYQSDKKNHNDRSAPSAVALCSSRHNTTPSSAMFSFKKESRDVSVGRPGKELTRLPKKNTFEKRKKK